MVGWLISFIEEIQMRRIEGYRKTPTAKFFAEDDGNSWSDDLDAEIDAMNAAGESGDWNDYFDTYGGDIGEPIISDSDSDPIDTITAQGFDPYTGLDSTALLNAYDNPNSSWYDDRLSDMNRNDLTNYVDQAYGGSKGISRTLDYDYDPNNLTSRNDRAGQQSRLNRVNDAAKAYYYANSQLTNGMGKTQTDRARELLKDRDTLNKVYNAGEKILSMRRDDPHLTGNKYGNFIGFDGKKGNTKAANAVSNKSLSDRWNQYAKEQFQGKNAAMKFADSYNPFSAGYKANDIALDLMGKGVPYNEARQLAEDWMDKTGVGNVAANTINAILAGNTVKDLGKGVFNAAKDVQNLRNMVNNARAAYQMKDGSYAFQPKAGWVSSRPLSQSVKNNLAKNLTEKAVAANAKDIAAGMIPAVAGSIALGKATAGNNSTPANVTFTDINGKSNTYTKDGNGSLTVNGKSVEDTSKGGTGLGHDITFNPQSTWNGEFKAEPTIFTGTRDQGSNDTRDQGSKETSNGPSDTFTGDDSASVDTPQTNTPTQSGYNNNAVQEQADKQREINKSNGRIGLSEDPNRTNYDVDDWNRGMTSQSSELVSDKQCKGFVIAIAKKEPAVANWMQRVADYYK